MKTWHPHDSHITYENGTALLDRDGVVWIVCRDGGMVHRPNEASPTNITSAGIAWLERTHGPLRVLYNPTDDAGVP